MNEHYPRIRIRAENGYLLICESLNLSFYMRHPRKDIAPAVMRSLDTYLAAVGLEALGQYSDHDGNWLPLDGAGWARTRRDLLVGPHLIVQLRDAFAGEKRYQFDFYGKSVANFSLPHRPGALSAVSFWLPTEYLEEHGPARVRALALELAAPLRFCSGYAGLSFSTEVDLLGVRRELRRHCFRYPGLDIPEVEHLAWDLGTRIRGPAWLTFLGQPVLGELGGATALRSRLRSPGTTVEELDAERAVVTLGEWPEAGDAEQGQNLPAYRELARVLEPWLYQQEQVFSRDFPREDTRRWERRFLDGP